MERNNDKKPNQGTPKYVETNMANPVLKIPEVTTNISNGAAGSQDIPRTSAQINSLPKNAQFPEERTAVKDNVDGDLLPVLRKASTNSSLKDRKITSNSRKILPQHCTFHSQRRFTIGNDDELNHLTHELEAQYHSFVPTNAELLRLKRLTKGSTKKSAPSHTDDNSTSEKPSGSTLFNRSSNSLAGTENKFVFADTDLAKFLQSHIHKGRFEKQMEEAEVNAIVKNPTWRRRGLLLLIVALVLVFIGHIIIAANLLLMPEQYNHPYACTTSDCLRMSKKSFF